LQNPERLKKQAEIDEQLATLAQNRKDLEASEAGAREGLREAEERVQVKHI
jgi:hypothetical protein